MEEQQQVIWYRTNDPADVWREGVLIGCDPDVGITIVDEANPINNAYVCCLIGPAAPQWRQIIGPEHIKMAKFELIYKLWSGMIANGFWNSQIDDIQNPYTAIVSSAQTCPFGQ